MSAMPTTSLPGKGLFNGLGISLCQELYISLRSRHLLWLLFLPALAAACRLILFKVDAADTQVAGLIANADEIGADNAYGYFADALLSGLILLFLLMTAYAAFSLAAERDSGILRFPLIRQVSRPALLLGRYIKLNLLAALSVLILWLIALVMSALLWDFGPVMDDGYELISRHEADAEIRHGLLLALLPLPAALAFGLLISCIAKNATQAIAIALGFSLAIDLFKGFVGYWAYYFYASYQPALLDQSYLSQAGRIVRGYSDVLLREDLQQLNLWLPLPQAILLLLIGIAVFNRRTL